MTRTVLAAALLALAVGAGCKDNSGPTNVSTALPKAGPEGGQKPPPPPPPPPR
jgi:hypothetical protein